MQYWLVKSEPDAYSWDEMLKDGTTFWDGVRNYQASNNMKKMKVGDLVLFYHSGKERQIMGLIKVVKEYYPDHTDKTERFGMVDVEAVASADTPVTLQQIKQDGRFDELALVKQSRLSVMPVGAEHWQVLCDWAGLKQAA